MRQQVIPSLVRSLAQANSNGQLGIGNTIDQLAPVALNPALKFQSLVLGHTSTCGTLRNGTTLCWVRKRE